MFTCSGASVLSGITLTKLVGVVVLAGAKTRIFQVYYFRCVQLSGVLLQVRRAAFQAIHIQQRVCCFSVC